MVVTAGRMRYRGWACLGTMIALLGACAEGGSGAPRTDEPPPYGEPPPPPPPPRAHVEFEPVAELGSDEHIEVLRLSADAMYVYTSNAKPKSARLVKMNKSAPANPVDFAAVPPGDFPQHDRWLIANGDAYFFASNYSADKSSIIRLSQGGTAKTLYTWSYWLIYRQVTDGHNLYSIEHEPYKSGMAVRYTPDGDGLRRETIIPTDTNRRLDGLAAGMNGRAYVFESYSVRDPHWNTFEPHWVINTFADGKMSTRDVVVAKEAPTTDGFFPNGPTFADATTLYGLGMARGLWSAQLDSLEVRSLPSVDMSKFRIGSDVSLAFGWTPEFAVAGYTHVNDLGQVGIVLMATRTDGAGEGTYEVTWPYPCPVGTPDEHELTDRLATDLSGIYLACANTVYRAVWRP